MTHRTLAAPLLGLLGLLAACSTPLQDRTARTGEDRTGRDDRAERRETPPSTGAAATSRKPFEVEGRVGLVGKGLFGIDRSITIRREDGPPARLHVAEGTRITLDDRPARLEDLREGDEVKAVFDFDDATAVVLELEVEARPAER